LNKFALNRRVLIVGEGRETEYNYFVGFRNAFEVELKAAATSIVVRRGKGGNARNIVENAIKEAKKFKPDKTHGDRVFVLLDTEGHGRAPELPGAESLAEKHGIEIAYSSPAFEYWLLCHFERIPRRYFNDCAAVVATLDKRWDRVCKAPYDKADKDIFDRLALFLNLARAQALTIDLGHEKSGIAARRVNPSTQVYELIAILIGVRTGDRCPLAGKWKPMDNTAVEILRAKGQAMPDHQDKEANWQLSCPEHPLAGPTAR
jgi:hypothetical protein